MVQRGNAKMITYKVTGDFNRTRKFLKKNSKMDLNSILNKYGQKGVEALSQNTPKDTGKTAASWSYKTEKTDDGAVIYWANSNRNNGVPIALILQYGHGTGTGGYVQGIDYINPALKPIFDELAENAWKEVRKT